MSNLTWSKSAGMERLRESSRPLLDIGEEIVLSNVFSYRHVVIRLIFHMLNIIRISLKRQHFNDLRETLMIVK